MQSQARSWRPVPATAWNVQLPPPSWTRGRGGRPRPQPIACHHPRPRRATRSRPRRRRPRPAVYPATAPFLKSDTTPAARRTNAPEPIRTCRQPCATERHRGRAAGRPVVPMTVRRGVLALGPLLASSTSRRGVMGGSLPEVPMVAPPLAAMCRCRRGADTAVGGYRKWVAPCPPARTASSQRSYQLRGTGHAGPACHTRGRAPRKPTLEPGSRCSTSPRSLPTTSGASPR